MTDGYDQEVSKGVFSPQAGDDVADVALQGFVDAAVSDGVSSRRSIAATLEARGDHSAAAVYRFMH